MIIIKRAIIIAIVLLILIGAAFTYLRISGRAKAVESVTNTLTALNNALNKKTSPDNNPLFYQDSIIIKSYISEKELAIRTMEEGGYWNCGGGRNTTAFVPDRVGQGSDGSRYSAKEFRELSASLGLTNLTVKEVNLTDQNTAEVSGSILINKNKASEEKDISLILVKSKDNWLIREIFFKFPLSV